MVDLLPSPPLLAAFLAASFILAVTPGPGVIYIVAQSLAHGRRSGFLSVVGVAAGNLCNAMGAAIGLGALFAVSATAFLVVKYAGAVYLIYLGIQALRSTRVTHTESTAPSTPRESRVLRNAFFVALLNPKTALFFAAFLPQFMTPGASLVLQSILLGSLFVGIAAATDAVYALVAGSASRVIRRSRGATTLGRYATGGTFIGLGVAAALGGARSRMA